MKTKWLCFWTLIFISISAFSQDSRDLDYIRMHARLAVEEMHLYKIPASITLSQGILETGGGQSRLAEKANNHFGIKCKAEWTGPSISHTDDAPNECFRVYGSVQESYRDHSKFLAERPFYKNLFLLDLYDYKSWAHGLKKSGYATNPKYANILISRIEKYKLNEFDRLRPEEVESKLIELYGPTHIKPLSHMAQSTQTINEVYAATVPDPAAIIVNEATKEVIQNVQNQQTQSPKIEVPNREVNPMMRLKKHEIGIHYIVALEGESFTKLAQLYDMSAKELAEYNELPINGKITPGQYIFLGKKKNKGAQSFYKVQEGDNMYLISQKVGMKINNLYKLNKMNVGQQPKVGTVLNLKTKKK